MEKISTLTVNLAVDNGTSVNGIKPTSKLRCSEPIFKSRCGGINVSGVIDGMGGASQCLFMAVHRVTQNIIENLSASRVHQQSTFRAVDRMVAPLIYGLSIKKSLRDALRFGIACGTAATIGPRNATLFTKGFGLVL